MKLQERALQFAIAVDETANTLFGSGYADETISAYAWRKRAERPWLRRLIDSLFFFQPDHCRKAYESEVQRKHLPQEYRPTAEGDTDYLATLNAQAVALREELQELLK